MPGPAPDEEALDRVLARHRILERLAEYDPRVIGTIPLGVAVPSSDVDIACCAPDLDRFVADAADSFDDQPGWTVERTESRGVPAVVARFFAELPVELFAQPVPVEEQLGFRHFALERRILDLLGEAFRQEVRSLREGGLKTEPAFLKALGLRAMNPYLELLELEPWADDAICAFFG